MTGSSIEIKISYLQYVFTTRVLATFHYDFSGNFLANARFQWQNEFLPTQDRLATRLRRYAETHQRLIYPVAQAVPSLVVVIIFYLLLPVDPNSSRGTRTAVGVAALVTLMLPATTALWLNGIERVLSSEYLRMLRARGLSPSALWVRHVLPNVIASSGILTQAVFSLAGLVVGSAFVEGVFRLGGVAESFIEGTRHGHAELCAFATLMYFSVTAVGIVLTELIVLLIDPEGKVARADA